MDQLYIPFYFHSNNDLNIHSVSCTDHAYIIISRIYIYSSLPQKNIIKHVEVFEISYIKLNFKQSNVQ